MDRRLFLTGILASGVGLTGKAWAVQGPSLIAGEPQVGRAILADSESKALMALFGTHRAQPCEFMRVSAPHIALRGLDIQVEVRCAGRPARALALIVQDAEQPLAAFVRFSGARNYFSTALCLEQTSRLVAYVQNTDGLFSASTLVKVTRGGYGTN